MRCVIPVRMLYEQFESRMVVGYCSGVFDDSHLSETECGINRQQKVIVANIGTVASRGRKLVSDFLQEIARNVYGGQCRYILQPDDHSFMSFDTDQLSFDTFELPLRNAHPVAGT